ncbi:glutathione S-transferase family protein [Candidatus Nitrosacidococcus tergens]|uniref:S-transferase n=1 Tax=Candidatus Nitrosacidococcus tergens TaxID=553981 RepID=A0A7G1QB63_9GAMM|nr:glutathione S-transferase family protein [Candidatus Nitrosacidococcus tergens]CAB1276795.1 S-transferase [Candidatus Nitrosacidococcus tergens]
MGLLVNGQWHNQWYDTKNSGGRFKREVSQFRNWITPDGSPGLSGEGGFKAESNRYHLYVSYACPWAHRTLIMRAWKGLEKHISISVVHPLMLENGWEFRTDFEGATGDNLYGFEKLYQLYIKANSSYTGRSVVPILWDKQQEIIVNNESSEIIRMLNSTFDHIGATVGDYYPDHLHSDIDAMNSLVYDNVNNGVYKAGFATSQEAYDEAVTVLFDTLEELESKLEKNSFLVGNQLTEADLRLWTSLLRFDPVYVTHFKCDQKRIADYPNLSHLLHRIYHMHGVADTVHWDHIRNHYFRSHPTINPYGIISIGPILDL